MIANDMPKWVGLQNTRPLVFARKEDNPQPNHYTAIKVNFGLHGWFYCALSLGGTKILMPNGKDAIIHKARLYKAGHVIGLRDLTTCDHTANPELIEGWRGSLSDRIKRETEGSV